MAILGKGQTQGGERLFRSMQATHQTPALDPMRTEWMVDTETCSEGGSTYAHVNDVTAQNPQSWLWRSGPKLIEGVRESHAPCQAWAVPCKADNTASCTIKTAQANLALHLMPVLPIIYPQYIAKVLQ